MSTNKHSLNLSTFVLNSVNLIEQLQDLTISADNKTVDSKGIADRYSFAQAVKQSQKIEITAHRNNSGDTDLDVTSLDISIWSPGGDQLALLKSGSIKVTTHTVDQSGAAAAYEVPVPIGTDCEMTSSHMIAAAGTAANMGILAGGDITAFEVTGAVTVAGKAFSAPMLLSAGSHKIVRGELQMEDVTLKLRGTPTLPTSDATLLYLALIGAAAIPISTNTGADTYVASLLTIASYGLDFKDGALIEERISLLVQGALTVS